MSRKAETAAGLAVLALLLTGCSAGPPPVRDRVDLGIPDRGWDPDRPDRTVGWCGETCIQMAMGFYGKEVSQVAINKAGRPAHPDLYENDIEKALESLSVAYVAWDRSNHDANACVAWIVEKLRRGYPLICGVKIYPDENPTWLVDHFVLAVGFSSQGLLVNTNTDGQERVPFAQLVSRHDGLSLRNHRDEYYIWAITGLR
ncbi:MAG TPA: C39 family peptidase [Phycisphaerae bacterium]|nr:C39 family peptidase [Phycisphaerae bacterium]HRY66965.1 C39 family peptidase [Phycisphaerae bacterium]HSA29569.1 C39 family peptidase [Phycisphaerae bacterium]